MARRSSPSWWHWNSFSVASHRQRQLETATTQAHTYAHTQGAHQQSEGNSPCSGHCSASQAVHSALSFSSRALVNSFAEVGLRPLSQHPSMLANPPTQHRAHPPAPTHHRHQQSSEWEVGLGRNTTASQQPSNPCHILTNYPRTRTDGGQEDTIIATAMPFSRPLQQDGQPASHHNHTGHTAVPPPSSHPHAFHLTTEASFGNGYQYGMPQVDSVPPPSEAPWGYANGFAPSIYGPPASSSSSTPSAMPLHCVALNGAFSAHKSPRKSLSISELPSPSPAMLQRQGGAPVVNKKKRSRSPSQPQDQVATSVKRPGGLEKRNSSSAGTAKMVEKDGQTTTIFQCRGFGDCSMTFTRSEHLARHIRKHTGERPFRCHCGKSFSRLDNLRQHAQTVHADETERNEAMMQELTNLHASLAASAAQAQHAQALIITRQETGGNTSPTSGKKTTSNRQSRPAAGRERKGSKQHIPTSDEPSSATTLSDGLSPLTPLAGQVDRVASFRKALPSAHLGGPSSPSESAYSYPQFAPATLAYRNSDPSFGYGNGVGPEGYAMSTSIHPPHSSPGSEAAYHSSGYSVSGPRASYPFDADMESVHGAGSFAARHGSFYARYENLSASHSEWAPPTDAASRRDSLEVATVDGHALAGALPPAPPSTFGNLFPEQCIGFSRSLSANQVRTSTLAKAHPLSPSLPPTSQGRPPTSDRPILPPLTSSGGTSSRPDTSSGALSSFLPPLSPTQASLGRPGSSHGEGWFRPPTASGDLGRAFRFQRRNSMLDLPEMSLDSRPATSGAMLPPEGAPPHSRAGASFSRGSTGLPGGPLGEKLRPLSSSGCLGSSGGIFGESSRLLANGAYQNGGTAADDPRTSPNAHSPFRFQPPPLARCGPSYANNNSSSVSVAASFFRDRPLTSHSLRSGTASAINVDVVEGSMESSKRIARFLVDHSDSDDAQDDHLRDSSQGLSSDGARSAVQKKRPFTSGDIPLRRFGSPVSGDGPSQRERESSAERNGARPSARPDSSRRVSIASLIGQS